VAGMHMGKKHTTGQEEAVTSMGKREKKARG